MHLELFAAKHVNIRCTMEMLTKIIGRCIIRNNMDINLLKDDCKTKAQYCLANYYIFLRKRKQLNRILKFNTVLGVIVPALLGAVISTYGQKNWMFIVAGTFGCMQLVISVITLVYKWDDLVPKYLESAKEHRRLYDEFSVLYLHESEEDKLIRDYKRLIERNSILDDKDSEYEFSRKEDRIGNRYSYYIMKISCPTCSKIPNSLAPSKCDTCGNY